MSIWQKLVKPKAHRRREAQRAASGPLARYYERDIPASGTPFDRMAFLAIDLETTGLDPETDEIISFGYVPIIDGTIHLDGAAHLLVRPEKPIPEETAVIHGLLDEGLRNAPRLDAVLPEVLDALAGRVPVAHHSRVERDFLGAACRRLYGQPLEARFACTLALERRSLARRGQDIGEGALRLNAVRERYGLPRYHAHNALMDALAAGELFLAQAAHASGRDAAKLGDLLV